jgi:hypothetical protein
MCKGKLAWRNCRLIFFRFLIRESTPHHTGAERGDGLVRTHRSIVYIAPRRRLHRKPPRHIETVIHQNISQVVEAENLLHWYGQSPILSDGVAYHSHHDSLSEFTELHSKSTNSVDCSLTTGHFAVWVPHRTA